MKKVIAIALVLTLCFFPASCSTVKEQYKTVIFRHAEILSEQLEFTIPNSWIYEEICDEKNLINFYRSEDYAEIGNVTIKNYDNTQTDFCSDKEKLVPSEYTKYKKLTDNCFVATDKNRGSIICCRINDGVIIDIFLNIIAEKNTVENIAENFSFSKIKIADNKQQKNNISEEKMNFEPHDISFLDEESYVYAEKTYEQAYSVFLTIDTLAEIAKKPYVFTFTTQGYRSFIYAVEVDKNNIYGIIEDYLLEELLFVKFIIKDGQQNNSNYQILDRKPFTADTNLVNTWDAMMMKNGFQKSMLKLETMDKIIETNNIYEFIKNGIVEMSWCDFDFDGKSFSIDFYVPEIKAYFRVDELYQFNTVVYSLYRIDSNENSNIPQEYCSKYCVSKHLSNEANINNYKGLVR